jgi:hypothetical protein
MLRSLFKNERLIEARGEVGDCDFCAGKGTKTIAAPKLGTIFKPLLEVYEPAQDDTHLSCQTLAECLEEWGFR